MGLLDELQRKLEEAARQAQQQAGGGGQTSGGNDIPNPWDQTPQQPQQQQAPNFPPGYQQPQQQYPTQQAYKLGYQYGVQTVQQGGVRAGLMDDQEK